MRPCRGTYTLWLSNFIFRKFQPSEGFNFETRFIIYKWPPRENFSLSILQRHEEFSFIALAKKGRRSTTLTKTVHHRGWISISIQFKTSHRVLAAKILQRFDGPTCCRPATKYFHRVGRHMPRFLAFSSRPRSPNRSTGTVGREYEQLVIGTGQLPLQRTSAGIPFQSCALSRPINLGQRAINRARGIRNTEPARYLVDPWSPTYEPMPSFLSAPCCIW